MKEYEHSFMVKDIWPFIDFCRENGYSEGVATEQNRIVFENKSLNHVIARLTTETKNGKTSTVLDFKNVGKKDGSLNVSEESIPLEVSEDMKEGVLSSLKVMEFFEAANNFRKRYVFKKDGVTFEIDDYTRPEMKIVAIEGDEEEVEKVFQVITLKMEKFFDKTK